VSKPYSNEDLDFQLSRDLTWRIREISDLKSAIILSDKLSQTALLRALVTVVYAHWEGHVKFSAEKYLSHVAMRKISYDSLVRQFLKNDFVPKLAIIGQKSLKERGELIDDVLDAGSRRFAYVNDNLINTRSNLNFEVLCDICRVCSVDSEMFIDYANFIDVILLKRRNSIAHGEETFVDVADMDQLTEQTIGLMRMFSNDLQAKAHLRLYRALSS
jgi:MAE_28990/MAE_18760-like HEPN